MHIIISPAKSLDYETPAPKTNNSEILFGKQAQVIAKELRQLQPEELMKLMKISAPLAKLNHHRFQLWKHPSKIEDMKAALFAFKGEVYASMDAYSLSLDEVSYANDKLRILSGMYGLLRPLDNIMAYRLEMGTKIAIGKNKNLYELWGNDITTLLEKDMNEQGSNVLVNLASNEYFKAINKKVFNKRIVTPVFKDWKNGQYKVISFFAKRARGLMSRFIIQNKINNPDDLIAFNEGGYYFKAELSKGNELVFVRDHEG